MKLPHILNSPENTPISLVSSLRETKSYQQDTHFQQQRIWQTKFLDCLQWNSCDLVWPLYWPHYWELTWIKQNLLRSFGVTSCWKQVLTLYHWLLQEPVKEHLKRFQQRSFYHFSWVTYSNSQFSQCWVLFFSSNGISSGEANAHWFSSCHHASLWRIYLWFPFNTIQVSEEHD